MDSGLFTKVLSSPEVIVASLALIFLLPLVFFIASTRSRRRFVRAAPRAAASRTRRAAPAEARTRATGPASERASGPAAGPGQKNEGPEDLA